jgi:GNAT superfamily N-acetyltransferase
MPSAELQDLVTRIITPDDADAAAELSEQLGYPVPCPEMKRRIEEFATFADDVIYVACLGGKVVGWIHVGVARRFQTEPRAEIGGLVVSSRVRSAGIGRRLVVCAEEWARSRGLKSMVVRSAIARERAHNFYLREGYTRTKTSAVFTKALGEP